MMKGMKKVLYSKSIYDIFYFFLFEIVDKDIVFKISKRCDKYFPCLIIRIFSSVTELMLHWTKPAVR